MEENSKSAQKLHEITDVNYATILKARESWSMFSIMSEFIESTERLSGPPGSILTTPTTSNAWNWRDDCPMPVLPLFQVAAPALWPLPTVALMKASRFQSA